MQLLPEPPATFRHLLQVDQVNPTTPHDPEAWLLATEQAAARYADSVGLDVLGFPERTNRSFVVALGTTSGIHAIYKAPYPNSASVSPDSAIDALIDWGRRGLAPPSVRAGAAVVSEYIPRGGYFEGSGRNLEQYRQLLSEDLTFTGQPQPLERRMNQRRELIRGRRKLILRHRPDISAQVRAAMDACVADVERACDHHLHNHADTTTVCHGDFAHFNILTGEDGRPLLIDPEPIYGPREIDLARLLLDGPAALCPEDISALCSSLDLDERAVELEARAARAQQEVLRVFREAVREPAGA